jgi:Reverse transcriptase (RNA-dependent DNA polymerase)
MMLLVLCFRTRESSIIIIPVNKEHQWLMSFTTGEQVYERARAPFGLRNRGASSIRMLHRVSSLVRDCAWSYIDNLAVFSNRWDEYLKHLDRTLQCIGDCGLTLTLAKCDFAKPEFKFCSQIIQDPDKLIDIMQLKKPQTKIRLRYRCSVCSNCFVNSFLIIASRCIH